MNPAQGLSANQGIEILSLSRRSYNCLRRAGIHTLAQLISLTPGEVSQVPGLGPASLVEIQARLAEHSLSLAKRTELCTGECAEHWPEASFVHEKITMSDQIENLGLSVRARNCLKRAGIRTVTALLALTSDDLLGIRNLGTKTLTEIREKTQAYLSSNLALPAKVQEGSKQDKTEQMTALAKLDIPWRLREKLSAQGIRSVEEIIIYSEEELLRQSLEYTDILVLKRALSERGLKLASKPAIQPLVDLGMLAALHERGVPLGKISIARLVLPEGWEMALRERGFSSIQELATASEVVLKVSCFASYPDHVSEIKSQLNRYLAWLLQQNSWESEVLGRGVSPLCLMELSEATLAEILNGLLSDLHERERTVMEMRYGLDGQGCCTLEEIGEIFGITRERVRQLEKKALERLSKPKRRQRLRALVTLFENAFLQAGGVLNEVQLCEISGAMPNSGGVDILGAIQLVLDCDGRFGRVKGTRIWGLTRYPLDLVPLICAELEGLLQAERAPLDASALLQRFVNTELCRTQGARWPDGFIEACLRADQNIAISEDGLCALASWSSTRLDEIILAMRWIGRPAHFTDIAKAANELLSADKQLSPQYAYNILLSNALFVRVGRGVFGLAEWGLPNDRCLADAAYRVLTEANRPLRIDVLTDKVLETWQARRTSVLVAVENDERFCRVGYQTYWLRERIAQGKGGQEAGFSEIFGGYLQAGQARRDVLGSGREYDTGEEVEKLRQIGTDLFSRNE